MTTNIGRAADVIDAWAKEGQELNECVGSPHDIARRLADAGLLAPDLPAPYTEEGYGEATVTAWQPCYTIVRTDITGGAASEVEIPAGNVWIEQGGLIGFDVNHSEMYLDTADARDLALALLAAVDHAEGVGRADS